MNIPEFPIGYASSDEKIATVDADDRITALQGGKATITAYVMDGSNKRAAFTVNVDQRPDSITFDRAVYAVAKAVNATASVTLKLLSNPYFNNRRIGND